MSGYECHRHPTQISDDICGSCGRPFCEPCLFYLDGDEVLPLCNNCTLVAAGIRPSSSVRRGMSRRQLRRLRRERRRDGKPPTRSPLTPDPLRPQVPVIALDASEHDPFAWADDLDGGWSITFRP